MARVFIGAVNVAVRFRDNLGYWNMTIEYRCSHCGGLLDTTNADPLNDEINRTRALLGELVNAKALSGVRSTVAGWLGEGRADGPYEHRHPANLGARIETRCGPMYELDEIMQRVRAHLTRGQQT